MGSAPHAGDAVVLGTLCSADAQTREWVGGIVNVIVETGVRAIDVLMATISSVGSGQPPQEPDNQISRGRGRRLEGLGGVHVRADGVEVV